MQGDPEWWGLLGPIPSPHPAGIIAVPHDRMATLDREYEVGPVRLRPGGKLLTEYLRSEPYQLDGCTWFETWPVIAEGRWPGALIASDDRYGALGPMRGADANERLVSMWLHRVVALVALASGEAWQVRTKPVETSARPAEVPEDWPRPPIAAMGPDSGIVPYPRALPSWVQNAWGVLEEDTKLAAALTVWHQGLLLNASHPSFSLIAFCGAIETIAESEALKSQIDVSPLPCAECGNMPKAQARFWETIGLVRSPDEVQAMKKTGNPYGRRSRSAHGSRLFVLKPPLDPCTS